jgi:hypothetical protein
MNANVRLSLFVAALFVCTAGPVVAQTPSSELALETEIQDQNERRIRTNQVGMGVLMGWAGLNMPSAPVRVSPWRSRSERRATTARDRRGGAGLS